MAMKRVVKERIRGNLQGEQIVSSTDTAAGSGSLRKTEARAKRDHQRVSTLPAGKGTQKRPTVAPVLTSWKEIAQYVRKGKGVRTVQRWERELRFPVRRTPHATRSIVLAIPGEIDAWVRAQQGPSGQLGSDESERTALLRALKELRSENRELRRQLALQRAKKLTGS